MTKAKKIALVTIIAIGIVALTVCIVFNQQLQTNALEEQIDIRAEQVYDEETIDYYKQLYSDTYNFDDKTVVAYQVNVDNQTSFTLKSLNCYLNLTNDDIFLLGSNALIDGYLDLEPNNDFEGVYYFAVSEQLTDDEMRSSIENTNFSLKCKVLWKEMNINCHITVEE